MIPFHPVGTAVVAASSLFPSVELPEHQRRGLSFLAAASPLHFGTAEPMMGESVVVAAAAVYVAVAGASFPSAGPLSDSSSLFPFAEP